jgi:hydroxypyruvate isomerase
VYVARGVDSPFFGVLYDIYHSAVEGEDMAAELANAGSIVKYVQLADTDGRGEPGTGSLDWPATLATLRASGYDGPIGLEYYPTTESSESVKLIQKLAADA